MFFLSKSENLPYVQCNAIAHFKDNAEYKHTYKVSYVLDEG